MIDPELQEKLSEISENVKLVAKRLGGTGTAFWQGIVRGFGSIVGVLLALAIIGWILNVLGVIPTSTDQVNEWRRLLENGKLGQ